MRVRLKQKREDGTLGPFVERVLLRFENGWFTFQSEHGPHDVWHETIAYMEVCK